MEKIINGFGSDLFVFLCFIRFHLLPISMHSILSVNIVHRYTFPILSSVFDKATLFLERDSIPSQCVWKSIAWPPVPPRSLNILFYFLIIFFLHFSRSLVSQRILFYADCHFRPIKSYHVYATREKKATLDFPKHIEKRYDSLW